MKIKSTTPNLITEDIDATLDFFVGVLGFNVVMHVPDRPPYGWVMLNRDKMMLMFQSRKSIQEDLPMLAEKPVSASMALFTEVEGIQEWHDLLKGKTEIAFDLRKTFYGMTEFGFYDPNGYLFIMAERK